MSQGAAFFLFLVLLILVVEELSELAVWRVTEESAAEKQVGPEAEGIIVSGALGSCCSVLELEVEVDRYTADKRSSFSLD